ncbi:flagellar motor switch protein FliG [Thermodesulfobium acidiphilum]|uniref:Flagellar motor switch protein FliG n=1 Tax=Thermodesulfobium acidiphilum TaxID=1794699 RepID=A0A2R4W2E9_THEAF|nr:flagellar motor switch protein FliG [Thermodesulfobium acidiphilum]AWB10989.1 flagellar motor switch protein FliG [Thermodesulfobium acidiphilum]
MKGQRFTNRQKAAALLLQLGPNEAANVLKHLSDEDVELLTLEIAGLGKIDTGEVDEVLEEAFQTMYAREIAARGGVSYAKELLEKAFGPEKAQEILTRLSSSLQVRPFEIARKADARQLLNFLQNEHPQTIALVLAHLKPEQAGTILSELPPAIQSDVSYRLATMDRTSPDIIREVESVLERKLSTIVSQDFTEVGGVQTLAQILSRSGRAVEKSVLEALDEKDPELAENVRKLMFTFDDIVNLDDRSIQVVLREVDSKDLSVALKGSSEEVKERILKNLSQRAAQMLKEELEYMGPVRLKQVEEAQSKVVAIIRRLEEAGTIVISRGGEDEIVY